VEWTVRPVTVGTLADTPASLRRKASEFLRLASESQNADMIDELHRLALAYAERAKELENPPATQASNTNHAGEVQTA
jgi:hypothetical protein